VISCAQAKQMIENPQEQQRPLVIDTRGGYKDYFWGHLPTAHHLNFDTLRGTDKRLWGKHFCTLCFLVLGSHLLVDGCFTELSVGRA